MQLHSSLPAALRRHLNPKPEGAHLNIDAPMHQAFPLPLAPTHSDHDDRGKAFEGFARGMRLLDLAYDEIQALGDAIAEANSAGSRKATFKLKRPAPTHLANVDTAIRPVREIYPLLFGELDSQRRGLVTTTELMLKDLQSQQLCGEIVWRASDVARYSYFTWTSKEERSTTQVRSATRHPDLQIVKTTGSRTVVGRMTVHDLIDASSLPLQAGSVPRPPRVDALIASIPTWLRPAARIVTGTQIGSNTVEVYRGIERWVNITKRQAPPRPDYRFDPALIIAPYVLTGWE